MTEQKLITMKEETEQQKKATRLHRRHDRGKKGGEEEKDVNHGPQVLYQTRPHFIPRDPN
jgi:hypothetical protein